MNVKYQVYVKFHCDWGNLTSNWRFHQEFGCNDIISWIVQFRRNWSSKVGLNVGDLMTTLLNPDSIWFRYMTLNLEMRGQKSTFGSSLINQYSKRAGKHLMFNKITGRNGDPAIRAWLHISLTSPNKGKTWN